MTEREELILLAERVMGWQPVQMNRITRYGPSGLFAWGMDKHAGWNPKRSWDDAGMLVDALAAMRLTVAIFRVSDDQIYAVFTSRARRAFSGIGETFPEAIYRAALAWAQRDAGGAKQ